MKYGLKIFMCTLLCIKALLSSFSIKALHCCIFWFYCLLSCFATEPNKLPSSCNYRHSYYLSIHLLCQTFCGFSQSRNYSSHTHETAVAPLQRRCRSGLLWVSVNRSSTEVVIKFILW
jgi:hypothetical protein